MATIREQVIKALYEKWAEIKCRKNEITNEMWKLEQIEDPVSYTHLRGENKEETDDRSRTA